MRRESTAERAAWTRYVDGGEAKVNKYSAERTGKYASRHEAEVAASLAALERAGKIKELREQVRIVLVPQNGKLRAVVYVADFTYQDENGLHVLDAKGFKTPVYRLKKRLAALLLGITIEEV
jgi:hypothetical protein